MPIDASPSGTLDIENATLRSREIVALTSMVAGNDVVRSSGPPTLEVYGDPSYGVIEPRLELVSNTNDTNSNSFTQLTSNVGVFSIKTGTDASDNGTITFGGFANERLRITSGGNVGIGTTNPQTHLHIEDNSTGNTQLTIQNINQSGRSGILFMNSANDEFKIQHVGGLTANSNAGVIENFSTVNGGIHFYAKGDGDYKFRTTNNNNERMRIANDGKVSIGGITPLTNLDVNGVMQSFAGRHVKTVPIRAHSWSSLAANGGELRIAYTENGNGSTYGGSFAAFDFFGDYSINNRTGDRWVKPNRVRICFRWGFVAGYIGNVVWKFWEDYYGGSPILKGTETSYNGSLSRGFTTVWGPPMEITYTDVPVIYIEADSTDVENSAADLRVTSIWLEYTYEP